MVCRVYGVCCVRFVAGYRIAGAFDWPPQGKLKGNGEQTEKNCTEAFWLTGAIPVVDEIF